MARKLGLYCVVYTPPDHMERTPKGYWSGERILSWDFPHMERMLQLTAGELTAITEGLKQHGLPVYLMGLSLGGLYAAMAALNGAPVDGLMLITPAADMQPSMASTRIGRRYQAMLRHRGDPIPGQDLLTVLGIPYRARSFDRPLPVERIFLAHGIHDGVVPLGVVTGLAKRWQVPLNAYACGHMSLLFLEPAVQKDVRAFLQACLAGEPGAARTARQRAKARPARRRGLATLGRMVGQPLQGLRGAARPPKGGLPPLTPAG
jgi:pimeloyl-ACP methyl ester carboxylesterase